MTLVDGRAGWAEVAPELDSRTTLRRLTRIFRSRGFDLDDADDLAQEAVARALSHLHRHGRRSNDLQPLLNTIAKNLIVERFRTGGREVSVDFGDRVQAVNDDPGDQVALRDRDRVVRSAVDTLPLGQRRALRMWIEGHRPAEIARAMGIKRNAADALLHRARRQLAAKLEQYRDGLWSAGALVGLRVRGIIRRVATWPHLAEFSASYGPALAGLATVALLAVVPRLADERDLAVAKHRAATSLPSEVGAIASRTAREPNDAGRPVLRPAGDERDRAPNGVHFDVREKRASVITEAVDPTTGRPGPLGIEIYGQPEDDDGITGPIVNEAIDVTCSTQPDICEGR